MKGRTHISKLIPPFRKAQSGWINPSVKENARTGIFFFWLVKRDASTESERKPRQHVLRRWSVTSKDGNISSAMRNLCDPAPNQKIKIKADDGQLIIPRSCWNPFQMELTVYFAKK
jgi:hypothetical protein